jgi:hypothetical protein
MIDWSKITNEIRASGISMTAVAREVNSDWQHMNRLARGEVHQPKYSVGVQLLEIHAKVKNGIR